MTNYAVSLHIMRKGQGRSISVICGVRHTVTMLKKIGTQINLLIYTIKILWDFDKKGLIFIILLAISNGIYPIATLLVTQNIMNAIQIMEKTFDELVELLLLYSVIILIGIIISGLNSYYLGQLNIKLSYYMNYLLMTKCGQLSLEDLEKTETYDKITRLERDIAIKPFQALQAMIGLAATLITFCSATGIIFAWKKSLFLLILTVSFVTFLFNIKIGNNEFLMRFSRSGSERRAWYFSYLLTHDFAFKEVKAQRLQYVLIDKYKILCKQFISEENRINRYKILVNISLSVAEDIIAILVMFLSIKEAYSGLILIGTAMTFMNASTMVQSASNSMSGYIYEIYNSNLYMKLLKEFMDINMLKLNGHIEIDSINEIVFKDISYDYPNKKNALYGVNFQLQKGQTIAVVGRNGSGKTTLLKLLSGLYTPQKGIIKVNNIDITEIDEESLRKHISVLFQDYLKYEGTLLENVILGKLEEECEIEDIETALYKADVNFAINDLGSYDLYRNLGTWFENGSQLSGGQWQRVALARAFFKKASLYIFDEPSASLDQETEKNIFKNIFNIDKKAIKVFITHNIKLAQEADMIIILDEGKVVGTGTHESLLEECDQYRNLYLTQKREDSNEK